jgi:hypothetical protein
MTVEEGAHEFRPLRVWFFGAVRVATSRGRTRLGAIRAEALDICLSWAPFNEWLTSLNVADLVIVPTSSSLIYAATAVGGVFSIAVGSVIAGDCDGEEGTDIVELQQCVNIFLDDSENPLSLCPACDADGDEMVGINDLQAVVNCFLDPTSIGCPVT